VPDAPADSPDKQRLIEDLQRHLEEGWIGIGELSERLDPDEMRLLREEPEPDADWSGRTLGRLLALVELAEKRRGRDPEAFRPARASAPLVLGRHGTVAHEVVSVDVLLVEFEPGDRLHLIRLLEQCRDTEFRVRSADAVEEAPSAVAAGRFDVILLDLTRPAGSGTALLARAEVVTCGLPVVAIVNRDDEPQLIHMGTRNYLVKSEIDARLLANTLRSAVEHQRLADALESSQRREHFFATRDTMTGLPNRFAFREQLHRALHHAERHGQQVAVLFVDLDRFKEINDTLGHEVGDSLLITLAERMAAALRKSDVIARIGGDEFLLLLQGQEVDFSPARTAERLLECLSSAFVVDGREHGMSASIGIATWPRDGDDPDTLIRHADAAMYQAKAEGPGDYRFYSRSLNAHDVRRRVIEDRLRGALERGDLVVHYQPRVDAREGRIAGAEALLRWTDAELGPLGPAEFVPVAERAGMVCEIGAWVMREACAAQRRWADAGFGDVRVSVNVSPRQIRSASLRDAVVESVLGCGLAPGRLEIELTESAIVENPDIAARLLGELAEIGVELALDDFGTGYSSLSYLRELPVRTLKIDPSFVRDLGPDSPSSSFVDAILSLARTLGLGVVAEGVETEGQRDALLARGCVEMQGFLFSRPLAEGAFRELLRRCAGPEAPAAR